MSAKNITKVLLSASPDEYAQGVNAYQEYHDRLKKVALVSGFEFEKVVASFAALSPGNKLELNFKDLDTLVSAVKTFKEASSLRLHCYSSCTQRAYDYLTGWEEFKPTRWNSKTFNFYNNILNPSSPDWVTIDRHAINVWHGKEVNEVLRKKFFNTLAYKKIANDFKTVAKKTGLLPNQVQAITWYAWKTNT
jgi:hypothetical protein